MYTLINRGNKEYRIYTQEDADTENIAYQHWTIAPPGTWALSDDHYVCEVLEERVYRAGTIKVLSAAHALVSPRARLLIGPHLMTGVYDRIGVSGWKEREIRRTRAKNTIQAYVKMFLMGKIDWQKLGKIYRPDQLIPEATVKRFFKMEGVKALVDKELEKALSEKGITSSYVLDVITEAIAMAKEKESPDTMLKGARELSEILRMKDDKKASASQEYGVSADMVAEMDKIKHEIAKRTGTGSETSQPGGPEGTLETPAENGSHLAPSIN